VFFHACERFNNKFKEVFDTLIADTDNFVGTAASEHLRRETFGDPGFERVGRTVN